MTLGISNKELVSNVSDCVNEASWTSWLDIVLVKAVKAPMTHERAIIASQEMNRRNLLVVAASG